MSVKRTILLLIVILPFSLLSITNAAFSEASISSSTFGPSSSTVASGSWGVVAGADASAVTPVANGLLAVSNLRTCLNFVLTCEIFWDTFLNFNNIGRMDISSLTIQQTSNTSGGNAISLQTCNIGGPGTAPGNWTESLSPTPPSCSGTINTIMSTIGTGKGSNSPQIVSSYSLPIAVGESIRIRAVSTQIGRSVALSLSVRRSDLRAGTVFNS